MVMTPLFSRHQPGGVFTIQDMEEHPRNVLWVNSAHVAAQNALGGGQNPDKPFATLAYVMSNAASLTPALAAGDVIYLSPDHTETIAGAAGIACATAGVKVKGLGWGDARPTFTWSAVGSTWTVTAASVTIENIRTTCTAATTKMFSSSQASLRLHKVDYIEGSGIPLQFLLTTSASDRFKMTECDHYGPTAGASAQLWIRLIGCDHPVITNNVFMMDLENGATDACISGDASVVWYYVYRNTILQTGGSSQIAGVLFADGATGFARENHIVVASAGTIAGILTIGNAAYAAENYVLDTVEKSGLLDPVEDA